MIWPFKHTRSISNEEHSSGIEAMAEVIAKLKSECQSHRERADRYWELYNNLKKEIESGSVSITEDLPPYVISNYIKSHSIPYRLEEDSDYIRLFSQEKVRQSHSEENLIKVKGITIGLIKARL